MNGNKEVSDGTSKKKEVQEQTEKSPQQEDQALDWASGALTQIRVSSQQTFVVTRVEKRDLD